VILILQNLAEGLESLQTKSGGVKSGGNIAPLGG
jgi:hypothetical protein